MKKTRKPASSKELEKSTSLEIIDTPVWIMTYDMEMTTTKWRRNIGDDFQGQQIVAIFTDEGLERAKHHKRHLGNIGAFGDRRRAQKSTTSAGDIIVNYKIYHMTDEEYEDEMINVAADLNRFNPFLTDDIFTVNLDKKEGKKS